MRPFNLSKAIAGAPLICRDSTHPMGFHRFIQHNPAAGVNVAAFAPDSDSPLGHSRCYNDAGQVSHDGSRLHPKDLFIDSEPDYVYLNLYRRQDASIYRGAPLETNAQVDNEKANPPEPNSTWITTMVGDKDGTPLGVGGV